MRNQNQTYRKVYENGILKNPITKENPFISGSRADKRKLRKSNNRKGNGLVVAKVGALSFAKYRVVKQQVKGGLVVNSILV